MSKELLDIAELIARADLVILVFGEKNAALGPDIKARIVKILRETPDDD